MTVTLFLDSNILILHLTGDHPDFSPRATGIMQDIESGSRRAHISDIVIFETVYTLGRVYRVPRTEIRDALLPIIHLPGILLNNKGRFDDVFSLYIDLNISFADAYHAVLMRDSGLDAIASFDRHFDRVPDITRIDV